MTKSTPSSDEEPAKIDREGVLELWKEHSDVGGASLRVYETLREAILQLVLGPDTRLAEEELAEILGVSRTPIRESLSRLETERLVTRTSVRNVFVSHLSADEIVEIYLVREWLDGLAAHLAAMNATPPQVANMKWINDQMRIAAEEGDIAECFRLNLELHALLSTAAANAFLSFILQQVHDRVRRFPGSTLEYPGRAKEVVLEHDQIISAIERHNAETAMLLAREHMAVSRNIRIRMLEEDHES